MIHVASMTRRLSPVAVLVALSTHSFAGGITSGGGNTFPLGQPSQEEVREIVYKSAASLYSFFARYANPAQMDDPVYVKLFLGQRTIINVLDDYRVDLQPVRPCLDSGGIEMDGSADAVTQNVCVSLTRVSRKVSYPDAGVQTAGLLAHEFSHLVGLSESEAQQVQDRFLMEHRFQGVFQVRAHTQAIVGLLNNQLEQLNNINLQFEKYVNDRSISARLKEVGGVYDHFIFMSGGTYGPFRPLVVAIEPKHVKTSAYLKASSLVMSCDAQAFSPPPDASMIEVCRMLMERGFKGRESVTLEEWHESMYGHAAPGFFGNLVLKRLRSKAAVKAAALADGESLKVLYKALNNIRTN